MIGAFSASAHGARPASERLTRLQTSGVEPEGTERVRVSGRDATLVVWSPDYDGKGKA